MTMLETTMKYLYIPTRMVKMENRTSPNTGVEANWITNT